MEDMPRARGFFCGHDAGCLLTASPVDGALRGDADGAPTKRGRDEDDMAGAESDDENGVRSSLADQLAELERLKDLRSNDLQTLVDAVNVHVKKTGYPNLHKNKERDTAAYYMCGCREKGCFLVTFGRPAAPGKKDKARKVAREWTIKSIGEHVCEPHEPRGIAIANTWIPISVKTLLLSLFDQNIGAAGAHRQAIEFAYNEGLPTTWEKSDVKNFFDTIRRLFHSEDVVNQLEALSKGGHFVALDFKQLSDGRKVLNRAFIATKSMQNLFQLFGSFGSLDTTYGKNKLQLPVSFFVGTTNEGSVVPFAVCVMRSETTENYTWLTQSFYKCHKMLPVTIIVDGDKKLREAIIATASHHGQQVAILLCVWHLHCDLEKNMLKKTPGVDIFSLKKGFYELRACTTEETFEAKWTEFRAAFGTNIKAVKYLDEQLYGQRMLWAQPWTGLAFCGGLKTTGISESLHSLLASSNSSVNTLTDVLVLADAIVVRQCERSLLLSTKHETALEQLTLESLGGFVVASVSMFLSGHALAKLREINLSSCFLSVVLVDSVDVFAIRPWRATDLRFHCGLIHNVSQIAFPMMLSSQLARNALVIRRCLSKDVDLGHATNAAMSAMIVTVLLLFLCSLPAFWWQAGASSKRPNNTQFNDCLKLQSECHVFRFALTMVTWETNGHIRV
jgi:hypothetical protein